MAVRSWRLAILLPGILLAACDSMGPAGGRARIYLAQSMSGSAETVEGSDVITSSGPLTLAAIDSLWVTVLAVEAVKGGADSGSWQAIRLDSGSVSRLNLLALPSEGADSTGLAQGDLKEGKYDHIRLRIADSATIVLKQDVVFGQGTLAKGSYPLRIPSGQQTGLKIKLENFAVADDSASVATLVFDAASSLGNLIITGNGTLQMSPVLRARNP